MFFEKMVVIAGKPALAVLVSWARLGCLVHLHTCYGAGNKFSMWKESFRKFLYATWLNATRTEAGGVGTGYKQLARDLIVLMSPTRRRILSLLMKAKKPVSYHDVARQLGVGRRIVSLHLASLSEYGFVEGELKAVRHATKRRHGLVVMHYRATKKVDEVSAQAARLLP